ncbi:hypothetical protein CHARACLAT_020117 [Characodon lateralis]|uniref:Uncharacterized protein n=1 Tax=Characodon lateralis TaxID=208331 RepID=A0ABU7EXY0_9TELE|nr:hypothetical protein [Characodon lateralis]
MFMPASAISSLLADRLCQLILAVSGAITEDLQEQLNAFTGQISLMRESCMPLRFSTMPQILSMPPRVRATPQLLSLRVSRTFLHPASEGLPDGSKRIEDIQLPGPKAPQELKKGLGLVLDLCDKGFEEEPSVVLGPGLSEEGFEEAHSLLPDRVCHGCSWLSGWPPRLGCWPPKSSSMLPSPASTVFDLLVLDCTQGTTSGLPAQTLCLFMTTSRPST